MTARLVLLAAVTAGVAAPAARADVKLHPLFSDHMVLQRGCPVPVWGTAAAGEKVTVTGPNGATAEATADADGKWMAKLPELKPGVGFTLTVKGANTVELTDVLVGDVWLCSGQSNMEWKLGGLGRDGQGKAVADKAANPRIRLFDVPNVTAATPQSTFPVAGKSGMWLECTPDTALNFSAVGYFFGRDIEKAQDVPVGLVSSDWGGTPAQAWTSVAGMAAEPALLDRVAQFATEVKSATDPAAETKHQEEMAKFRKATADAKAANKPAPKNPPRKPGITSHTPTALYNGMIAPLKPFALKGAIWYQGESNAGAAKEYRTLFPAMIKDWRQQWGTDLPFLAVQLAPFGNRNSAGVEYAELRDAQLHATKVLPKVGIAVITDAGEEKDIHPQRKEPVGQRLALAARAIAYGEKVVYAGPQYKSMTVEGDKLVLTFDSADGLIVKGETLNGFTVCGEDKVFHPATAEIKGDTVVLHSDEVPEPKHARFGWVNFAKPGLNFFNKAGLPASPFRTDDFPLKTN